MNDQHSYRLAASIAGLRKLLLLLASGSCLTLGAGALSTPEPGYLYWPGGPPNLNTVDGGGGSFVSMEEGKFSIRVATGHYNLELNVRDGRIIRFNGPVESRITLGDGEGRLLVGGNQQAACKPDFFPVRIIESGPFFQHFAIHDLQLEGNLRDGLDGKLWLEVMAWPDRVRVFLKSFESALAALPAPGLGGLEGFQPLPSGLRQTLDKAAVHIVAGWEWTVPDRSSGAAFATSPDKRISVVDDPIEGIRHLKLAQLDYRGRKQTALGTPAHAGQAADYRIRLANPSDSPARLDLMVELPGNRSLTGHNLMLVNTDGTPTGIPVQISKNWHVKKLDQPLPYMGTWSHGRISLVLPPAYDEELVLKLIQGDYGDYHAASIAQLSLVGWGGNGFWIQAALGSWGETVCLQPGRVLRRTMMTDWRPFLSDSIGGEKYDWTPNAGGADIFVLFDEEGAYVPFIGNRHLIRSYGPTLAQMDFHETSANGKLEVRGTWYLPQSSDLARVYLKVRCDVLEDVAFSRFSLLQMGADQYNPPGATHGAFGNADGRLMEHPLAEDAGPQAYYPDVVALEGEQPWISLYGEQPQQKLRLGQAQRTLVLHDWKAVIQGEPAAAPHAAFYNSPLHGNDSFQAELVPGKDIRQLKKGDFFEMTLEFILTPLAREVYFGETPAVHSLLEAHANKWTMGRAIASGNKPRITLSGGKVLQGVLPVLPFAALGQDMTIAGTTALVPLRITGIPQPGRIALRDPQADNAAYPVQEWRIRPDGTWEAVVLLDPALIASSIRLFHLPGKD